MHAEGSIDVIRDIENIKTELLLADLQMVEGRIERIASGKKILKEQEAESTVLKKLLALFEEGVSFSDATLSDEESQTIEHLDFLTDKPVVIVVNVDDMQLVEGYEQQDEIVAHCRDHGYPVFQISAKAEMEISELDPQDRAEFMEELRIETSGVDVLAKTIYERLNLISFLTAGEDEVRAWTIRKGLNARRLPVKYIPTSSAVYPGGSGKFCGLQRAGSMAKAKELGKFAWKVRNISCRTGTSSTSGLMYRSAIPVIYYSLLCGRL